MGVNVYFDERSLIKTVMMMSISFWLRRPQKKEEIAMNPKKKYKKGCCVIICRLWFYVLLPSFGKKWGGGKILREMRNKTDWIRLLPIIEIFFEFEFEFEFEFGLPNQPQATQHTNLIQKSRKEGELCSFMPSRSRLPLFTFSGGGLGFGV